MQPEFQVNAKQLKEAIKEDIMAGLTPMVASSPGMGKSDIVRSVAKDGQLKVIDLRISQCEPVDMQGYPGTTDKGRMTFYPPEYFPLENDPIPTNYKGWILFLDELNSGNKQTEAACYKLILDRAVYMHKLHPMCFIVAAGNLSTDRAIVNTQSTATRSRLTHYEMVVDSNAWIDWANENLLDHRVISFIKFKPSILHKFDPALNELTFPCPRTWEFASKMVSSKPIIDSLTKIRLAGTVGEGAAVEFSTFTQIYQNLPKIEDIKKDPSSGWRVPTEPSEKYAVTTMLAHNIDEDNIEHMIKAVNRLPMDFRVITFRDIYKRSPNLRKHPVILDWISNNSSVLFD